MHVIENVKKDFWEDVAARSSHATFFHIPYWSDIICKTFGYVDITKNFIFDDGTRVVFPLLRRNQKFTMRLLNDYVSGPPFVYGGPIADSELNHQQCNEITEYILSICKPYNTILIRGNPYGPQICFKGFKEVKDYSHIVELFKSKDENDLFTRYSSMSRQNVRFAKKSHIEIRETSDIRSYEMLYTIYKNSFHHWKNNVLTNYPSTFFINLYNPQNQHIKLWAAYYNNTMIGGAITLYWNDKCTPFLSYSDRAYSKLNARRLLEHTQFLYCLIHGYKYYDFMQSGQIKNLEDYKESMGGKIYTHSAWLKENKFMNSLKRIYHLLQHA